MTHGRPGLTLIEVLVVFGIIAVLIGLLLPAVMAVRESAHLSESLNNLRQINLAAANYAGANGGRLPPLNPVFPFDRANVFTSLLPYIEQESLHAWLLNSAPINNYKRIKIVSLFLSPLDPDPVDIDFSFFVTGREITNYACNSLAFNEKPRMQSYFSDGLSNTIMFSEHYQQCGPVEFSYASGAHSPRLDPKFPASRASFADGGPQISGGDNCGDFYPITTGNPPVSSALNNKTFQVRPNPRDCDPRLPNSTSSRGLQAAMADGAVRLLAPSIAPTVFWGLVTPNGGEVLNLDW